MAVFKINKTKDYTVMSNHHLKEKEMSLKAKGLLSVMLSLPENWDYSISGIVAICKENESAINSTLKELKEFGYLRVDKFMPNQTKSGRIEYVYNIYEIPKQNQCAEKQEQEKQGLENQCLEIQWVENQGQYNINNKLNNNKENINIKENINTKEKEIFDYWNTKNIIVHKKLTPLIVKQITKALEEYTIDEIKECIDRYSKVYHDKAYYFNTKWTLVEFLKQSNAISAFTDEGSKWLNYIDKHNQIKQNTPNSVRIHSRQYTEEENNDIFKEFKEMEI